MLFRLCNNNHGVQLGGRYPRRRCGVLPIRAILRLGVINGNRKDVSQSCIRKGGWVFDDDATRILGEAFDCACKTLHDKGQPQIVYEVIAKRIIDAAKNGERDPIRLRNIGLAGLRLDKDVI